MTEALHAEWTKLRTLPGTGWLLLGTVALTVGMSAAVGAAVSCSASDADQDPAKISLTGISLGQAVVAILAVLAISGEYSTGMIRTTLTAMPRRATVLAAKAVVVTALTLVAGAARGARLCAGRPAHPAGPTASPPRTATSCCPWPTGRCCAPPPVRCSIWR